MQFWFAYIIPVTRLFDNQNTRQISNRNQYTLYTAPARVRTVYIYIYKRGAVQPGAIGKRLIGILTPLGESCQSAGWLNNPSTQPLRALYIHPFSLHARKRKKKKKKHIINVSLIASLLFFNLQNSNSLPADFTQSPSGRSQGKVKCVTTGTWAGLPRIIQYSRVHTVHISTGFTCILYSICSLQIFN